VRFSFYILYRFGTESVTGFGGEFHMKNKSRLNRLLQEKLFHPLLIVDTLGKFGIDQ